MKRFILIAASVMTVFSWLAVGTNRAEDNGSKRFQLVYHSDTRGYYRPCG